MVFARRSDKAKVPGSSPGEPISKFEDYHGTKINFIRHRVPGAEKLRT